MRQAIANLTSNAAKYNREGGSIGLELSAREGTAELAITNTGPAITADDQDQVFARFYRADHARSRRADGIGLGLSIAREIARAHGGDVALVESVDDRTVFCLTLPLSP